jgi:single-stranded-DNA-specific exonuclease
MGKYWRIHPHDAVRIAQLERSASVPSVVAQLLLSRGMADPLAARDFLAAKLSGLHDPDLLPGVLEAGERVLAALKAGRQIVVYGDYDADGMTGTALLYNALRLLGGDVRYHVPNRLDEGYGLNAAALTQLSQDGASLVISVDCGIGSCEEADLARRLGLELIVTDHHEFGERLPDAAVIVHPRLPGHEYPFPSLCGAGVAFKLAWSICRRESPSDRVTERMRGYLVSAVGLAALGTVADVVPLVDENRIFVRHGLQSLREQPGLGMQALLEVTGLGDKRQLDSEDLAFMLAPRLNAAGRLGQARLGVELLTTDSTERARALAQYIHELNDQRTGLERSIYLAANKQVTERFDPTTDPALVLAGEGWHAGVIGIVAGRLAEKYHLPVVLISLDELRVKPGMGSARSPNRVNLHAALAACTEHLLAHGGHAAAAGLKIDPACVDAFREAFCEHVAGEVTEADRVAEIRIDAEAPLSQLTMQTVRQIEQLAPFGAGNPRPTLCATGVRLAEPPKRIGGGERHLSLRISQHSVSLRAIAFGQGDWADELAGCEEPLDIAYRPVINEFRGRRSVELQLVDWRPSQSAATASRPSG